MGDVIQFSFLIILLKICYASFLHNFYKTIFYSSRLEWQAKLTNLEAEWNELGSIQIIIDCTSKMKMLNQSPPLKHKSQLKYLLEYIISVHMVDAFYKKQAQHVSNQHILSCGLQTP